MAIEVSSVPDTTASLDPLERIDAYEQWQRSEGVPVVPASFLGKRRKAGKSF